MKMSVPSWSIVVLTFGAGLVLAAEQPENPIQAQLFPPELLMQHREELGLTEQQLANIHRHLEQAGTDAGAGQKKLEEATHKLGELLGKEVIDERAALKQLDEVLDGEREMKRLHLQVMIRVKNELTAKQQRWLAEKIKQAPRGDDLRERLHAKMARIQKEVERRAAAGQPPEEAMKLMETFPEQMRSGNHKEAEAILDRVLKALDLGGERKSTEKKSGEKKTPEKSGPEKSPDSKSPPKDPKASSAPGGSKPPPARPTAASPLSPKQVRAEVDALRQQDVAWRKIAWKTCLIDGINASREQRKPIILWAFIDRPIDDERC